MKWNQVSRIWIALLVAVGTVAALARPVRAGADGADASRAALAARCDELIRSAVRGPYGWGWTPEVAAPQATPLDAGDENDENSRKPGSPSGDGSAKPASRKRKSAAAAAPRKLVVIDGRETALIGFELFRAGELLGNAECKQAAFEAARGVSAVQTRSGQVRARGVMGAFGGAPDPPADVPDRTATLAALGLWLSMIDAAKHAPPGDANAPTNRAPIPAGPIPEARPPVGGDASAPDQKVDERLTRPAAAAAHWLAGQQTPAGGWPVGYPADALPGKGSRILRLDTSEFRDAALTLLLAGEVLDSRELRARFDRCMDNLLSLRISPDDRPDRTLWTGVYDLQGQPNRRLREFGSDVDLLACRHAMQILLTTYLVTLEPRGDEAVRAAVKSIGVLPPQDGPAGRWHRFYDRHGHPTIPPQPTTRPGEGRAPRGMFARPDEALEPAEDTVDLGPLLRLAHEAAERGGPEVAKQLAGQIPISRRLAEVACGLSDDPLAGGRTAGDHARDAQPGDAAHPSARALQQPGPAAELWELLRQAEIAAPPAPRPSAR